MNVLNKLFSKYVLKYTLYCCLHRSVTTVNKLSQTFSNQNTPTFMLIYGALYSYFEAESHFYTCK